MHTGVESRVWGLGFLFEVGRGGNAWKLGFAATDCLAVFKLVARVLPDSCRLPGVAAEDVLNPLLPVRSLVTVAVASRVDTAHVDLGCFLAISSGALPVYRLAAELHYPSIQGIR